MSTLERYLNIAIFRKLLNDIKYIIKTDLNNIEV